MREEFEEEFVDEIIEDFSENDIYDIEEDLSDDIEILSDDEEEITGGATRYITNTTSCSSAAMAVTLGLAGSGYCSSSVSPSGVVTVSIGSRTVTIRRKKKSYKGIVNVTVITREGSRKGYYRKNKYIIKFR